MRVEICNLRTNQDSTFEVRTPIFAAQQWESSMIVLTVLLFCVLAYVWIYVDSRRDSEEVAVRVRSDDPKPRRNRIIND